MGTPTRSNSPKGILAFGTFLAFGAVMASLAGGTLIWRGTFLDPIWAINPLAYARLAPLGKGVGILFILLGGILAAASAGWLRRRIWGWRLAVAIIATQVLGDFVNALMGDVVGGGVGLIIAVSLLLYLLRTKVRSFFEPDNKPLTE